ncbi:MAG: C25 family cysteine peptidase [Caldilineales bacterium]|nr:C25 family cysteine peptidase [Caldilineales bacterium]MDW8317764.1 C25 family cysteine peptidase [Anaerolineae bacterium]
MRRERRTHQGWLPTAVRWTAAAVLALTLLPGGAANAAPATTMPAEPRVANVGCPFVVVPFCLKLIVAEDGLVRVTTADLQGAGWNVQTVDPRSFSLSSQGRAVALRLQDGGDGRLDPGDFVEFYGQRFRGTQMDEKYTDDNVYWLAAGGSAGPRMAVVDATPGSAPDAPASFWTTHHAEENHHWFTHNVLGWPTQDTWWWTNMYVSGPRSVTPWQLPTVLPAPASEVYTATLQIEVAPRRQYGAHRFQVFLNDAAGQPLLDDTFFGHVPRVAQVDFPGSLLRNGENVVLIHIFNQPSGKTVAEAGAAAAMRPPWVDEALNALQGGPPEKAADGTFEWMYANYYTVRYRRLYRAVNDEIVFSADQPGTQIFTLHGFTDRNVRVYDITNPLRPARLGGVQVTPAGDGTFRARLQVTAEADSRYLALTEAKAKRPKRVEAPLASAVRSPNNGADWIIITHADFLPQARRLAAYRAAQDGFRTAVVNVAELYEQFNHGIFHPEAIRRFVAFAVQAWQPPAPQYIVLLGDGNWNFKGYGTATYGQPDPNWIPPYLVWEDPWQGEVPSDNAFVNLDDDPLPELAIGRLPARSLAEATTLVDKIIAYEAQRRSATPWRQRMFYVTDNSDSSGDYPSVAENVIRTALPPYVEPVRNYLGVTFPIDQVARATDFLVDQVNAGVSVLTYMGHGSVNWWAVEGLWNTSYTSRLSNADRLPLVVTLNCLDGYFVHGNPGLQSVAEEMLRHPGGGSVAAWSPTGLGTTYIENILNMGLLEAFFQLDIRRIGPATMHAKAHLYNIIGDSTPYETALLHTMTVFGDPALRLSLPTWRVRLPVAMRGVTPPKATQP